MDAVHRIIEVADELLGETYDTSNYGFTLRIPGGAGTRPSKSTDARCTRACLALPGVALRNPGRKAASGPNLDAR